MGILVVPKPNREQLLSFFDEGVLGDMLESLQKLQGIEQLPSPAKGQYMWPLR